MHACIRTLLVELRCVHVMMDGRPIHTMSLLDLGHFPWTFLPGHFSRTFVPRTFPLRTFPPDIPPNVCVFFCALCAGGIPWSGEVLLSVLHVVCALRNADNAISWNGRFFDIQ